MVVSGSWQGAAAEGRVLVLCQVRFPQVPATPGELAGWDGRLSLTLWDWF